MHLPMCLCTKDTVFLSKKHKEAISRHSMQATLRMWAQWACKHSQKAMQPDKLLNTLIFMDNTSHVFFMCQPILRLFYVNYVSRYFKSTQSSEKWFEVFRLLCRLHLKTFEYHQAPNNEDRAHPSISMGAMPFQQSHVGSMHPHSLYWEPCGRIP